MKKLFFTLLTLCLCGATYAANGTPDITIEGVDGGNTYYFDIVSAEDYTVELTYNETWDYPAASSYSGEITDIPETITYEGQEYSVIGIGDYTFANCSNVTKLVIPSFIQYIGIDGTYYIDYLSSAIIESSETPLTLNFNSKNTNSMFYGCGIKELIVNRNITVVGADDELGNHQSLCNSNTDLQKVSVGGAATEICDYAFHRCTSLTDITLSDSITTFGQYAFDYCAMTELTIPASVKTFGDYCFANCSNLTNVFLLATDPSEETLSAEDFNADANVTIYVPRGCAATYYASTWESVIVEANLINGFSFNFFSIDIDEATLEEDTESYYATYYMSNADYEVEIPEGCTLYAVTSVSDGVAHTEALEDAVIPTGTPLLIQTSASGTHYFWKDYYDEDGIGYFSEQQREEFTVPDGNMLYGHATQDYTSVNGETDGYKFYKLSLDPDGTSGSIGFYYGVTGGGSYLAGSNRCWLAVPTDSSSADGISLKKGDSDDTTGISAVESASEKAVSGIYTIQGVRVSNMNQPGLYIVDGKKVLVK